MTLLRAAAALAFATLLCACVDGAPSGDDPVGAPPLDPMTDTTLGPDPLDPGSIDDNVGTPF
jgi:hypothetical protein